MKSVGNTNVVNGILCARYWSLILQFTYEKEGILVLDNEETAGFSMFHDLKTIEDDEEFFPTVVGIPNAMLCKVDPSHPILVSYLKTINPNIEIGVLLTTNASPYKKKKGSKKSTKGSLSTTQPEQVEKVVKSATKKEVHTEPPLKVVPTLVSKSVT